MPLANEQREYNYTSHFTVLYIYYKLRQHVLLSTAQQIQNANEINNS